MTQSWFERLQNLFTAVTFAEAGEPETARKYLEQQPSPPVRARSRDLPVAPPARRAPAH